MSISYTPDSWAAKLAEAQRAQQASNAFLEINDIAINYNTEYEALEAMAQNMSPYGEAWYYDPVRNAAGDVIGMDFVQVPTSVENPPAVINSNVSNPVFTKTGERIRINGSGGGTPPNKFSKGAKFLSTELPAGSTVAGRLGWLVAATALGAKLGKKISSTFYDLGGGWEYNPENWRALVDENSPLDDLDKAALRILFGLDEETGSVTPYLDSDALGAMYLTLLQSGAFGNSIEFGDTLPVADTFTPSSEFITGTVESLVTSYMPEFFFEAGRDPLYYYEQYKTWPAILCGEVNGSLSLLLYYTVPTVTSTSVEVVGVDGGVMYTNSPVTSIPASHHLSKGSGSWSFGSSSSYPTGAVTAHYDLYPLINATVRSAREGVENDTEGATDFPNPNTITGTDLATVNQQLRQNYPDLYDDEIYEDVPQPDGTTKRKKYVPVPFPNTLNPTKPITGDNHQNNPTSDASTNTDEQLDDLIDLITDILTPFMQPNPDKPTETTPPDTGTGSTPAIVTPAGSASSLWSVYNPTQAQVDSFGGWLWSSNFVEQLKKLFNDPMQAIVGIHKVFATPATGETRTIVCGYIDSEVPSKIVTSQYTTIDCGTVNLREYYGNVFDYSPFTEISLYLPFIGIVKLDVGDVMRASIKVKYHVDVITGACLADVIVTRDNAGGVLYQYSGSAIVTYPISSGSYASAIGGILSIAGGIAATVMTGGAAAPAVLGAAAGVTHLHSDVQKSGSFTGAAGAMGGKKPYLIISRPQTGMPTKFAHLQGYPVNHYTKLGDCTGHVRVSDVQVKGVNATDTELDMIYNALLQGVEI